MKIEDIYGEEIEVTDLHLALMQADDLRHMTPMTIASEDFVNERRAYWQDIYDKLINLAANKQG